MRSIVRPALGLIPLLLVASPCAAAGRGIDLEVRLDLSEGLVRAGAWVPVRLTITNRTDYPFDHVRVDPGGPVQMVAPMRVEPAETRDAVVPVFYAGGDFVPAVACLSKGVVRAEGAPKSLEVTRLPDDVALVGLESALFRPEGAILEALRAALGGRTPRYLTLEGQSLHLAVRCGLLDAAVVARPMNGPLPGDLTLAAISKDQEVEVYASPYPPGVRELIQPSAHRLFGREVWPAADRRRLWLWLATFAFVVLVAALFVSRRRVVVAVVVMAALAAAAGAVIWRWGGVRASRVTEARVCYEQETGRWKENRRGGTAIERFVRLESRGPGAAPCRVTFTRDACLPVPVLTSSTSLFQAHGVMYLGESPAFESARPGVVVRVLERAPLPPGAAAEGDATVARVVVEGGHCSTFHPRRRPSHPVAVRAAEWKRSPGAALAYAGRSLAWWTAKRQIGDGPFELTWVLDVPSVPAGPAPGGVVEHLPALVVRPVVEPPASAARPAPAQWKATR